MRKHRIIQGFLLHRSFFVIIPSGGECGIPTRFVSHVDDLNKSHKQEVDKLKEGHKKSIDELKEKVYWHEGEITKQKEINQSKLQEFNNSFESVKPKIKFLQATIKSLEGKKAKLELEKSMLKKS